MANPRKAQIIGEVFKYAIVGVFSIFILIAGYSLISVVRDRACKTEIAKFEIDLKDIDKNLRAGEKEMQDYDVPCKADSIYFFDLNKKINSDDFKNIPIIKDSLESGGNSNVFVVENGQVKHSFYAGNLEMIYPNYICFVPKFDKISFFAEGTGASAMIRSACNQPECTLIPANISEEQSRQILQEAVQFGCRNCPNDADREAENIRLTRQNVDVFRRFLFCDGITEVQIIIKPKQGKDVKNFRFYEFIPKTCIDDLNKYLDENDLEGEHYVKGDPLIVWHFSDLGEEKKISYKLNTSLDEECRQAIKGLGVAQIVEQKENLNLPGQNKILRFKSSSEELKGGKLEKNLWDSTDYNGNKQDLAYRIVSQNANLVKCEIKNEKNLGCERKEDNEGISEVLIEVSDGILTNSGTITINVNQKENNNVQQKKECEDGENCGFLKLGKCKKGNCCEVDTINPFC